MRFYIGKWAYEQEPLPPILAALTAFLKAGQVRPSVSFSVVFLALFLRTQLARTAILNMRCCGGSGDRSGLKRL